MIEIVRIDPIAALLEQVMFESLVETLAEVMLEGKEERRRSSMSRQRPNPRSRNPRASPRVDSESEVFGIQSRIEEIESETELRPRLHRRSLSCHPRLKDYGGDRLNI